MFERYTEQAKNTVVFARQLARQFGSLEITPEHILLALLNDEAITRGMLGSLSVEEIRSDLAVVPRSTKKEAAVADDFPLNSDALKALFFAAKAADQLKEENIRNEHLLIGLLGVESCPAAHLLKRKGITAADVRSKAASLRTQIPAPQESKRSWRSLLDRIFAKPDEQAVLLRRISKLLAKGKRQKALKLIDKFLADPAESRKRIRSFTPVAASIARAIGDVSMARKYYEQALDYSGDNAASLYGMADVLDLQGEHEKAREYAVRCYQLAVEGRDPLSKGFVELIEKRFPDLGPSLPVPGR